MVGCTCTQNPTTRYTHAQCAHRVVLAWQLCSVGGVNTHTATYYPATPRTIGGSTLCLPEWYAVDTLDPDVPDTEGMALHTVYAPTPAGHITQICATTGPTAPATEDTLDALYLWAIHNTATPTTHRGIPLGARASCTHTGYSYIGYTPTSDTEAVQAEQCTGWLASVLGVYLWAGPTRHPAYTTPLAAWWAHHTAATAHLPQPAAA